MTTAARAPYVQSFMLKLSERQDRAAADWPLMVEALLKEAFATVDLAVLDPR